jgi:peptidoglycan L-alanyl-D-glutamate endopeptidase CwlK
VIPLPLSALSLSRLDTCQPDLQRLFEKVGSELDISILCGHRGKEEQELAFTQGRTTKHWPYGNHNTLPSEAVDVELYRHGLDLSPREQAERGRFLMGYVLATAHAMGIPIRSGGDWDGDGEFTDQTLVDLPHFELVEPDDARQLVPVGAAARGATCQ